MTNFERLFSDKAELVKLLDSEDHIWLLINNWWCKNACPHRVVKQYDYGTTSTCSHDECIDKHTSEEVIRLWLDVESCDLTDM